MISVFPNDPEAEMLKRIVILSIIISISNCIGVNNGHNGESNGVLGLSLLALLSNSSTNGNSTTASVGSSGGSV